MKRILKVFTWFEITVTILAIAIIIASHLIFGGNSYTQMIASILGVFAVLFTAKGNPLGQVLLIAFAVFYGIISFASRYYGEMITYIGMSLPMAIIALISWLKNPYKGNKSQVKINTLKYKELCLLVVIATLVTIAFYFILRALGTANLLPSTISVTTSFIAAYLTFRRSPLYALGYALNDIVLIVLWGLMAINDRSYITVVACFVVFFVFDLYGLFNWHKMANKQKLGED